MPTRKEMVGRLVAVRTQMRMFDLEHGTRLLDFWGRYLELIETGIKRSWYLKRHIKWLYHLKCVEFDMRDYSAHWLRCNTRLQRIEEEWSRLHFPYAYLMDECLRKVRQEMCECVLEESLDHVDTVLGEMEHVEF